MILNRHIEPKNNNIPVREEGQATDSPIVITNRYPSGSAD